MTRFPLKWTPTTLSITERVYVVGATRCMNVSAKIVSGRHMSGSYLSPPAQLGQVVRANHLSRNKLFLNSACTEGVFKYLPRIA